MINRRRIKKKGLFKGYYLRGSKKNPYVVVKGERVYMKKSHY